IWYDIDSSRGCNRYVVQCFIEGHDYIRTAHSYLCRRFLNRQRRLGRALLKGIHNTFQMPPE
ncbi:hypothetical protein L9F63_005199, partial [Diploptera punctata]